MRRYVKSDYEATIPQDLLFDPDGGENSIRDYFRQKGAEDKKAREDAEARVAREKAIEALKVKYPESKIKELSEMTGNIDDIFEAVFEFLVPSTGKCDSVAGELVRAMMRVIYRDFNGGDVFYEGYGKETCLPSVAYIIEQFPDMYDDFDEIAQDQLMGSEYTAKLNDIADEILSRLFYSDYELFFWMPNSTDSRNTDTDEYDDWEPEYEYEGDFPNVLIDAIDEGVVFESQVEEELEWILTGISISYDHYSISDYGFTIYGLDRNSYDELSWQGESIGNDIADNLLLESD